MASPAAILQVFVNANTKVASAQLAAFEKQLHGVGKTSAATGAGMGKFTKGAAAAGTGVAAVGAAAIIAGKELYQLGKQFDDAYDTIRVGTGATGRELNRLKGSFRNVAKEVPNDFQEIGTAIADLNTRLGLTGKPLEQMAENLLHVSQMTGTDLQSNIKAVARSFVDWEVSIPRQTKALDGLFRLSQASGASIDELADSIQKFGSPLRQLGFSFEESAAMFANFERAGVNTQTMVPGLKLAISNLTRPTEALGKQMAQLGIQAGKPDQALRQIFKLLGNRSNLSQIEKTGLAMDVFGKRAGADMAEAIKQGRFELDKFIGIMRNGDSIQKASEDTYDFSENMRRFGNTLKVTVEPAATAVFNAMTDISRVLASDEVATGMDIYAKTLKGGFQLFRGDFEGLLDTIKGEDAKTPFRDFLNSTRQDLGQAMDFMSQATTREETLRQRQKAAIENVKTAQQRLNRARKQHGPNSEQAIVAEARYELALEDSLKAKRKLNRAERQSGAVRRATKAIIGDQVGQLKVEIAANKRLIAQKDRKIKLEESKEQPSAKKIRNLQIDIVDLAGKNERKQGKVNKLILEAGSKIGPKFARSLERMNARTATMKQVLGELPGPLRRLGGSADTQFKKAGDASKGFRGAVDRTKKRVNDDLKAMPPVVRSSTQQMIDTFKQRVEAVNSLGKPRVSKRRGGRIPSVAAHFAKGGVVPAAVSPGEMISYGGESMIVPGRPEPRDSVLMGLPVGAKVFTWDGQVRLMNGASEAEALRKQAPHFAQGGLVKPKVLGGSTKANQYANKIVDGVHGTAKTWLGRIAKATRRGGFSGASGQYPGVSGDTDFTPALGEALSKMARATGQSIYVQSGWRSYAEQAALYQAYLNGTGNLAAPPGSSNHESGRAADITPGREVFGSAAGRFGLGFTVPSESWHIELLRKGGLVGRAIQRFKGGGWVKTGYTVFDDAMGYRGPLSGKAYAELGAPNGGVGYISRLLGINKELPLNYPLDVKVNGKIARLFKRDIGTGQGTSDYSIDIWKSMWPYYGLNQYSKGPAWMRTVDGKDSGPSKKEIEKRKREESRRKRVVKKLAASGLKLGNNKLEAKIDGNAKAINLQNDRIDLSEKLAGASFGPGGSEETPEEIAEQVKLYTKLLDLQKKRARMLFAAMGQVKALVARYKGDLKKAPKWKKPGLQKGISNGNKTISSIKQQLVGLVGSLGFQNGKLPNFSSLMTGSIGDTNFRLKELGFTPPPDTPEVSDDQSELASLLREQLQLAQRNLAISQAQMPIFQQFMPKFHQGGIVQGPRGAERPIMAQAGEGVFTRDQMRAMGAGNVTVVIEDGAIDSNRIRVEVDGVIQEKVSTVRRQGSNRRFR